MTDYDLPEEIPGADKALDLVKMGTDKLFDVAWRWMAFRHRRDEITFIFLEHAHALTEEVIALLHSGSGVPTVGSRNIVFERGMISGENGDLVDIGHGYDEVASRRLGR